MANFTGNLNANEIFGSIYNMIISQQVFADNIKGTNATLVDKARVEGSLYGDTKLYYATNVLKSSPWGNDGEATDLLRLYRPADPEVQAITLNQFRQIALTVDNYLSKRAWSTEGAFSSFNSVMVGWIRETKRIYDSTLYNAFIGTCEGMAEKATLEIPLASIASEQEKAMKIAESMADLFVDMTDVSTYYNDYGYLRSYALNEIKVVWNSKWVNKIKKIQLPTIFHKDGLMDKFEGDVLPAKYFGHVNESSGTTPSTNTTVRSLVEKDFGTSPNVVHLFPGMLLPNSCAYAANETYTVDEDIICKVYTVLPPIMSAFEVGTSFFNPKSLTENHYLTWGYNKLEHLKNYPMITVESD